MSERQLPHDWLSTPLPENVSIADRSWLYSSLAFAHYRSERPTGVRVGRDTGIYHGTFFDLGPEGEVAIGDHCTLVSPIFALNSRVSIGSYAFISFYVVFADSPAAVPGGRRSRPGRDPSAATIALGDDVWIGVRAVLLPGARIGDGAIVGAAAVVDFDVPPCAIVAGSPARIVGWSGRGAR